jgi:uncharacterized delta-60 repeat protein
MKRTPRRRVRLACASLLMILNFFVLNITLTRAGTLDPGFGSGGKATVHIGQYNNPKKVFIQPDGKIVVAGETAQVGIHFYAPSPVLARYNSNGTLDTSFGSNGVVPGQFGNVSIADAAMQPDGKIVLVGGAYTFYNAPALAFAVVRYTSDGVLDSSFGINGAAITDIGGSSDSANAVVLLPDGKILVAGSTKGSSTSPGALDFVRYNSDGTLDTTFGDGGVLYHLEGTSDSYPVFQDMVLLPDGKLLTTGYLSQPFFNQRTDFLARFNSDGSFDTTFGNNGFINMAPEAGHLTLQPDGKFLVTSSQVFGPGSGFTFILTRFNSDGSVDNSFGTGGSVQTLFRSPGPAGNLQSRISEAIVKSNGDIIAVGTAYVDGSTHYFAVAQYNSSGALMARTLVTFTSQDSGTCLALQPDGKIILAGFAQQQAFDGSNVAVARLTSVTNDIRPYRRKYNFLGTRDEFTVYRPGAGGGSSQWYDYSNSQGAPYIFGIGEDIIAPADFNDDGYADIAVFRPSNGTWYIANSLYYASTDFYAIQWGANGDIPVADDYDGDGKADVAVFRPSNGTWYILLSQTNSPRFVQFGTNGDKPVIGDYDGDGKVDIAVFRPSNGYWYILRSSDNQFTAVQFGVSSDIPVQGDYNGDNITDIAVFRPSNATWYTSTNPAINYGATQFGASTDTPVPGDYDGDGKTDLAVFRSATRSWYVRNSSNGTISGLQWGASTDTPVPGH